MAIINKRHDSSKKPHRLNVTASTNAAAQVSGRLGKGYGPDKNSSSSFSPSSAPSSSSSYSTNPTSASSDGATPSTTITTSVPITTGDEPRARGRSGASGMSGFNDDAEEKRRRRSSIRSASEKNRRRSLQPRNNAGPSGSNNNNNNTNNSNNNGFMISADAAFDSSSGSCVPIMANFEEWMKLVKENKINANNSWNFALIDYFHDMSVLKEGDGINFQKASFTLDGCVKIYTSRVDSVASETGKLLSGLADRESTKNGKRRGQGGDGDDEDDEENDEDGDKNKNGDPRNGDNENDERSKRSKRKHHRSENTLAKSFSQIQVKKLELELAVDPLFRKMCSDFNEGGAHSLLLNNLGIDSTGRVVFDGQADNQEEPNSNNNSNTNNNESSTQSTNQRQYAEQLDLDAIRLQFFQDLLTEDPISADPNNPTASPSSPAFSSSSAAVSPAKSLDGSVIGATAATTQFNLDAIDQLTLCPSLPMLEEMVKDPTASEKIIQNMEAMRMEAEDAYSTGNIDKSSLSNNNAGKTDAGSGSGGNGWDDPVEIVDGSMLNRPAVDGQDIDMDFGDGGAIGPDYGDEDDDGDNGNDQDGNSGVQDFDDLGLDLDFGEPGTMSPSNNGNANGSLSTPSGNNIEGGVDKGYSQTGHQLHSNGYMNSNPMAAKAMNSKGMMAPKAMINSVDIMAYFDESLKSNWAGPEHWKIQKVKTMIGINNNANSISNNNNNNNTNKTGANSTSFGDLGDGNDGEKMATDSNNDENMANSTENSANTTNRRTRRPPKEPFQIDFLSSDHDVPSNTIFVAPSASSSIDLPKIQRKSRTKNLLPVDEHFSSKELIRIFMKPKAVLFRKDRFGVAGSGGFGVNNGYGNNGGYGSGYNGVGDASMMMMDGNEGMADGLAVPEEAVDEAFFAQNMKDNGQTDIQPDFGDAAFGDNGGNGDDGDDDDDGGYGDFAVEVPNVDDDELAVSGLDGNNNISALNGSQQPFGALGGLGATGQLGAGPFGVPGGPFGSKRYRSEYVSYAKSAKKVDVKLLKNNIWKVLDLEGQELGEDQTKDQSESQDTLAEGEETLQGDENSQKEADKPSTTSTTTAAKSSSPPGCNFSDIRGGLQQMYPKSQLQDISTSFCFISLLHLANEKGLVLESNEDNSDIAIRKDASAARAQLRVSA